MTSFVAAVICATALGQASGPTREKLSGKWEGDGFVLVLDGSGSGTISDAPGFPGDPMTWKVKGHKLYLTIDGETVGYAIKLDGDTLRASGGDLDQPVTLKRTGGGGRSAGDKPKGGTCEGACRHILTCAKSNTPPQLQQCVAQCSSGSPEPNALAQITNADCKTALRVLASAAGGRAQGGSSPGAGRKECEGCVRDGSSCVWVSQGNWGTGWASPYSGAASDCDPSCCGL